MLIIFKQTSTLAIVLVIVGGFAAFIFVTAFTQTLIESPLVKQGWFYVCVTAGAVGIAALVFAGAMFVNASNVTKDIKHSNEADEVCQYPGCSNASQTKIELKEYRAFGWLDVCKKVLAIENAADFNVISDSFTYAPDVKQTHYDEGTYLVPQGDGSLKVENRTYKYEYTTKGKSKTTEFVEVNGCYCADHAELARATLKKEIFASHTYKNPVWIICLIAFPICVAVFCIALIRKNGKKIKEIGGRLYKV